MIETYLEKLAAFKERGIEDAVKEYSLQSGGADLPKGLMLLPLRKTNTNEVPLEAGGAVLWRENDNLHVLGIFEDSDVFNTAVEKNERTWCTGDVLEFFVKPPSEDKHYFEVHLTPDGITLELRIPSVEKLGKVPFESQFFDSGMKGDTGRFDACGLKGWWGHLVLPGQGIEIKNGDFTGTIFSVCRYNYNQDWEKGTKPETSTISFLPSGGFHQPACWCCLV